MKKYIIPTTEVYAIEVEGAIMDVGQTNVSTGTDKQEEFD